MNPRHSPTLVVITLLAAGCGEKTPPPTPPLPVTVAPVGQGSGSFDEARYAGSIQADASVDVAFRVSGIVEEIVQVRGADGRMRNLQDGDLVRRGDMLARLRQDEYQDQVSDADASLRQAEADFERTSQLYENRSLSKADYDAAYARFTATRARLNQARISLGDATLRAPINGVILRRTVEVGSLAGPSAPAFTVADTRNVKVVFGVPDVTVSSLRMGGRLAIGAEAIPGETLWGRVTRISPSADPNSRVFEVEAALPNTDGRLKVGMLASLHLDDSSRSAGIFVPLAAIVRPLGDTTGYAVYVVRDSSGTSSASLRRISLGDVSGNQIAVTGGLTAGERVIVRGSTLVADGQAVMVMP